MKWIRRLGLILGILLVLAIAGLLIFLHQMDFSESDEDIQRALSSIDYPSRMEVIDFEGQPVHYVEVGDADKPVVMFVHGSPGTWDNFLMHMTNEKLLEQVRLIAVTRPGYGESGGGQYEPSLEKQAAAFLRVLELRSPNEPAILLGHSYGGPVIARMAMDAPEKVASLILAAASIDPELEKTMWFQIPAAVPPIRWLVPPDLSVCNLEILALKDELDKMMHLWKNITQPVTVIHGDKDNLVPIGNAEFAERVLVNAPVRMMRYPEMNHFVIWTHPQLIEDSIMNQLEQLQTVATD